MTKEKPEKGKRRLGIAAALPAAVNGWLEQARNSSCRNAGAPEWLALEAGCG
ncbi:MAG: hypothetical protein KME26_06090 [Oscillatoria princeps RMCB-10]|nr:hypothetical protein [Oscillatoria princeps RMCB-10]